jgi:hypothetical protein
MDTSEVMKAFSAAQRVVRQIESVAGRIDRSAESPLARMNRFIDGPLTQYSETVARVRRQNQTSLERYKRATAGLDRHQFNRASRVLDAWQPQAAAARAPRSAFERRFPGIFRRRQPDAFELYLRRAHEHPAVARRGGGKRRWFEEWRRIALLAVADGYDFGRLRAAAHGVSPPRRRRDVLPRPQQRKAGLRRFEERLRHSIYPNGPTPGPLSRCPIQGGGLPVSTG